MCFVLDDYGAVHAGGAANDLSLTGGPYFGWDIARALSLVRGLPTDNAQHIGLLALDGFGGVHSFSTRRPVLRFYFDRDVAEGMEIRQEDLTGVAGDIGVFVLDRTGGVWTGGAVDPGMAAMASLSPPLDGTVNRAVDLVLADTEGTSGWVMDNHGHVSPFGGAADAAFGVSAQRNWIALAPVGGQLVRADASGRLEWSDTPLAGWDLPMLDAGMLVDMEVEPERGLVGLDRFGALHATSGAILPPPGSGPPYFGFEAARDLEIGPPLGR